MQKIHKIILIFMACCLSLQLQAQVTATVTHISGNNLGSISLQIVGNNGPYSFIWKKTNSPNFSATTQNITNLTAGQYCVTVSDNKCCEAEQCFDIRNECDAESNIKIGYKKNQTICDGKTGGVTDGKIELDVPNPNDYVYCWKQFPTEPTCRFTTQNIEQLGSGTYYVTVTNRNNGCKVTLQTSICCCYPADGGSGLGDDDIHNTGTVNPNQCQFTNPAIGHLQVNATPTPPTATGANNGSINLTMTGGNTNGYTIRWSGPNGFKSNESLIANLEPGTYCYTVTDGCAERKDCFDMYVCESSPMSISLNIRNKPCTFQGYEKTGILNPSITGGKSPYKYQWSGPDANNSTQNTLNNIGTGQYCVTITDKSGCTGTACIYMPILPAEYERKGCRDVWTCGKEVVKDKDNDKTDWKTDPLNCRYKVKYCKDDLTKIIERIGPFATTFDDCNASCIVNEYCPDGTIFRTHFGEPFEGLNRSCVYVWGCFFPSLNQHCIYREENRLKIAIIMTTPKEFPPNGFCHREVWCDGVLISEFNGPFPGSPCDTGGGGLAINVNTDLDNQASEYLHGLTEGKPNLVIDNEHIKERVEASIAKFSERQDALKIINLQPNPFNENFTVNIQSPSDQRVTANVFDFFNNLITQKIFDLKQGFNTIEINQLSELQAGIYIFELIDAENRKASIKVIK